MSERRRSLVARGRTPPGPDGTEDGNADEPEILGLLGPPTPAPPPWVERPPEVSETLDPLPPLPDPEDDDPPEPLPPVPPAVFVALGAFSALVGALNVVVLWGLLASGGSELAVTVEDPDAIGGVRVRTTMTQKPGFIGVVDPDAPVDAPDEAPAPAPEGAPVAVAPGAPVADLPPAAAPAPPPQPAPPARPAGRAPAGTLTIRSNRRVMVTVDGKAVGYTPLEVPAGLGDHEITAMVPGEPATRQTATGTVGAAGDRASVVFSF